MGGVTQVNYGASALAQCLPTQTVGLALDTTIFTYGSLNKGDAATVRPISVRDPNGIVQNMQYDASTWNSAVSTRAADGAIDRLYYDGFGRPDSLVDPMGVRTFFRHDQSGRVVHTKTGTGLTTPVAWTFFNPSGLVDSVRVYGSGDNFSIGQDSLPQTAIQTTVNFFDRLGFVDSTRTPAGRWQRFLRDRLGNPIWEYPGNGTYLTRGYDWQGRLIAEYLSPILVGSAFADATTNSVYSGLGVAQGYSLSNGQLHQYGYDAKGRMFSMNDSVVMHTRSFNPAGALVSDILTFADGPVVTRTFQFNRRGQRTLAASAITGVTLSTGESKDSTFYSYNAATARIDSMYERVLTPGGVQAIGRVRWSFDAGGRETLRRALVGTGPGELYIRTAYDAPGRVSLTQDSSTAGIWYRFGSPGYNLADELRTTANGIEPAASGGPANAIQGVNYGFDYDDLATRRLLHSGRSATGGSTKTYDWIYDLFGNRLREIRSGVGCVGPDTSLFSGDNVLRQTLSAPCNRNSHYWTDFAGNRLVQVDTGGATGPQQVLSYTAKNQLFFSLTPTSSLGTYDYNWHWYDGSGLRVITQVWSQAQNGWNALIAPTATTGIRNYYVYDGSDVALTLVKSGGSWWVRSRYLSGGLDDPIAGRFSETASSTQQNLGLVNDRQGTTLAAMKPDGTQEIRVWWFSKNPFGMSDQFTGSGNQINTETGFGGASAPNTNGGFVYLRNRWYDPSTGRFLTQDPIGLAGGVNLYSYAGNNPVGFTDPFGLCPEELRKKADQGECYQWNQQQKNEAIEIINDERAGGNKNALSVPDPSKVVGVNGVAIPGICQKRDSHSNTGCTDGNLIYVNADRDPAAISQTLVHERQHDTGTTQAARSEPCARLRAVFYVRGMSNSHFSSATSGNLPAYTETAPVSRGSCGF
jgi:RHS repeat-associated protein